VTVDKNLRSGLSLPSPFRGILLPSCSLAPDSPPRLVTRICPRKGGYNKLLPLYLLTFWVSFLFSFLGLRLSCLLSQWPDPAPPYFSKTLTSYLKIPPPSPSSGHLMAAGPPLFQLGCGTLFLCQFGLGHSAQDVIIPFFPPQNIFFFFF